MLVLAGLGNPGSQYAMTRHNIGFMIMDVVASVYNFPSFKVKFKSEISEGFIDNRKVLLCKPLTFMNLSGTALSQLLGFYKIALDNLYVFHDDLDLDLFKIKLKKGGGNGGHNGLASLDQFIGKEYWRLRFGIGRPLHKTAVSSYVLSNFPSCQHEDLSFILSLIANEIPNLFTLGPSQWLSKISLQLEKILSSCTNT